MDWGNSRERRAPGVGAMNPVLSHFHWVQYRSIPSKAGLIKIKIRSYNMDTKGLSPVGLYFFQKYDVIESTCSKLHRFSRVLLHLKIILCIR